MVSPSLTPEAEDISFANSSSVALVSNCHNTFLFLNEYCLIITSLTLTMQKCGILQKSETTQIYNTHKLFKDVLQTHRQFRKYKKRQEDK